MGGQGVSNLGTWAMCICVGTLSVKCFDGRI